MLDVGHLAAGLARRFFGTGRWTLGCTDNKLSVWVQFIPSPPHPLTLLALYNLVDLVADITGRFGIEPLPSGADAARAV